MGFLDFFLKDNKNYDPEVIRKQQPVQFDDEEVTDLMQVNPNKELPEYKELPPVIFGNG